MKVTLPSNHFQDANEHRPSFIYMCKYIFHKRKLRILRKSPYPPLTFKMQMSIDLALYTKHV